MLKLPEIAYLTRHAESFFGTHTKTHEGDVMRLTPTATQGYPLVKPDSGLN